MKRLKAMKYLCLVFALVSGVHLNAEAAFKKDIVEGRFGTGDTSLLLDHLMSESTKAVTNRNAEIDLLLTTASYSQTQTLLAERDHNLALLAAERNRLLHTYNQMKRTSLTQAKQELTQLGRQAALLFRKIEEQESLGEPTLEIRHELADTLETSQMRMLKIEELHANSMTHPHLYQSPLWLASLRTVIFPILPLVASITTYNHFSAQTTSLSISLASTVLSAAAATIPTIAMSLGIENAYQKKATKYYAYTRPILREAYNSFWNELSGILKIKDFDTWEHQLKTMSCTVLLTGNTPTHSSFQPVSPIEAQKIPPTSPTRVKE